ncbi:pyridoxal phosphate-dependent aminotransferase [Halochromatium salexigens]|uniref:Histidinol-phosphate aminotransferase n=1 Tax=Halochromatium salexigens TaxID=49447 RepID=A0AAJ0UIZ4_HALSE|nr:aminotransferase class I/II-fold pyridoxal phosphate-dependent enzyme [Halochromatium salexigens]MBK5931625.1 histidinol-phosphate transaminase [Halochromatium salexigens]
MSHLVETLIRPEIQALKAYDVPDATGLIKLDAMENPYRWPEALRDDWLAALREAELNRYPDPQARDLQAALREAMAIPPDMGVLLGNGSDELIQMLALAVAAPGEQTRADAAEAGGEALTNATSGRPTLLSLDPGFVMYRMIARFVGLEYVGVALSAADFALDLDATLAALEHHRPLLTFIAYPNNPTGNLFDPAVIERIIAASPGLVIVDEAYAPFTDASFLPRLGDWPNLLVMRTVSKMGLAGLRLGYLAGPADWIEQIDKVRLPYNINCLSQASATFALRHRDVLDAQTETIRSERDRLASALAELDGGQGRLEPFPSDANFILVRTRPGRAGALFTGLRERGLLIKHLDGSHPLLADCLRITVGTPDENAALLAALAALLDDH